MVFLVVGPGRCGSSYISKILNNNFNINMGKNLRPSNKSNPLGFWEDLDFKILNDHFVSGNIGFIEFDNILKSLIEKRNIEYNNWGVKDPRLCYILGNYLSFIFNPIIIRCKRSINRVSESMTNNYGWSLEESKKICADRESRLDFILEGKDVCEILFLDRDFIPEEEILEKLKTFINV